MRVLILSCSTGGGHNSAAGAIKSCFEAHGIHCDIADTLELHSKGMSKIISRGHVFVYRHLPKAFGVGYRFEEKHGNAFIYQQSAVGSDDLYNYIVGNKYDTVICVHVFPSLTMTAIRKKYNPDIKMYFVATDYTCSPGVQREDMDAYFVPCGLREEFVSCGVPNGKIAETGIPVRTDFFARGDKKAAKCSFGLDENKKTILLMCGSMGCGPIYELTEILSEKLPDDAELAVVCGSNEKLARELSEIKYKHENVKIFGYVTRMNDMMDASDLMMSKPGGLSSTEALAKGLPIICINAVPGCETRNLDFFLKNGYALYSETVEGLSDIACEYIACPEKLEKIKNKVNKDFCIPAAEKIYDCVLKCSAERKIHSEILND